MYLGGNGFYWVTARSIGLTLLECAWGPWYSGMARTRKVVLAPPANGGLEKPGVPPNSLCGVGSVRGMGRRSGMSAPPGSNRRPRSSSRGSARETSVISADHGWRAGDESDRTTIRLGRRTRRAAGTPELRQSDITIWSSKTFLYLPVGGTENRGSRGEHLAGRSNGEPSFRPVRSTGSAA